MDFTIRETLKFVEFSFVKYYFCRIGVNGAATPLYHVKM